MMPEYHTLHTLLKQHGQEHILAFWDTLAPKQQDSLRGQIESLDFGMIKAAQSLLPSAHKCADGKNNGAAEPLSPAPVTELSFSEQESLAPVGAAEIRAGKVGVILVGPRGQTLYLFNRDRGGTSSCYGRCARSWPPLRAYGRPVAMPGSGVKQAWLSTTRRRDGIVQVTYQGHPLYVNGGDTKPGSLKGANAHEFGGTWYDVPVSGVKSAPV